MSTLGKVFAVLNIFAALGFAFLAVITLQKHKEWRERAGTVQSDLDRTLQQNEQLEFGQIQGGEIRKPGVVQLETKLQNVLIDRGRAWYKAMPGPIDAATGSTVVELTLTNSEGNPVPHQIQGGAILYAFDEARKADGGSYLGAFKVTGLDGETKVALAPLRPFTPEEIQRLTASQGKANQDSAWSLYEIMPRDRGDLLADLSEDELKALFPVEVIEEYIKDGKEAAADDPADHVEDGKYVRALRDYTVLFRELDRQMTVLRDRVAATEQDGKAMEWSVADAQQQIESEQQLIKNLQAELVQLKRELAAVVAHREKLEAGLASTRAEVTRLFEANKAMAVELERMQVEQLRKIDGAVAAPDTN